MINAALKLEKHCLHGQKKIELIAGSRQGVSASAVEVGQYVLSSIFPDLHLPKTFSSSLNGTLLLPYGFLLGSIVTKNSSVNKRNSRKTV